MVSGSTAINTHSLLAFVLVLSLQPLLLCKSLQTILYRLAISNIQTKIKERVEGIGMVMTFQACHTREETTAPDLVDPGGFLDIMWCFAGRRGWDVVSRKSNETPSTRLTSFPKQ